MRLSLLLALLALGGCGSKEDPGGLDSGFHLDAGGFDAGGDCRAHVPGNPGIVYGTGEVEWTEVTDGDPVPFVHGPQDGYHFWGAVKQRSIDTSDAGIVAFAVFDDGDQINSGLGVYARPGSWVPVGDGWSATFGYYVVLYATAPEQVDGHTLCVVTRVTDASHTVYEDERTITLTYAGDM